MALWSRGVNSSEFPSTPTVPCTLLGGTYPLLRNRSSSLGPESDIDIGMLLCRRPLPCAISRCVDEINPNPPHLTILSLSMARWIVRVTWHLAVGGYGVSSPGCHPQHLICTPCVVSSTRGSVLLTFCHSLSSLGFRSSYLSNAIIMMLVISELRSLRGPPLHWHGTARHSKRRSDDIPPSGMTEARAEGGCGRVV
jgi:hypothetical protein